MKFSQASKMAISTIRSNKLRTFLTMLGIIIGVMAVTLLVSPVEGATNKVTDSMNDLGGDELVVQITSTTKRLTLHEVESLEGSSGIQYVSPTIQGSDTAVAEGNSHDVSVVGITDRYGDVQGLDILNGRTFTQTDTDNRLNVAIIGYGTAEDLYGTTDVLEQNVHVLGRDYRIVGVLKDKEDSIAGSVNDTIYIPLTNAQRWLKSVSIQSFYVSARQDRLNEAQSAARSHRRNIAGGWRDWHHEHHAGFRYGANPRNRYPKSDWCTKERYRGSVPDRVSGDLTDGRSDRHGAQSAGPYGHQSGKTRLQLCHQRIGGGRRTRLQYFCGHCIRNISGGEGSLTQTHQCTAL